MSTARGSMFARLFQPSAQKMWLIAATLLAWGIIGAMFLFYGYLRTWRLWGVPATFPFFLDLRQIPAMVAARHIGLDPTMQNPFDPMQRVFNYPSIWYLLGYTDLSQADVLPIGIALLGLFFLGVFSFPGPLHTADLVPMLLVMFSPAAMFLYERGNIDLLMFFLCALAVTVLDVSWLAAILGLSLAAVLKWFPLFGLTVFMSKGRRAFLAIVISAPVLFFIYFLLDLRGFLSAWVVTPRVDDISYGVEVFAEHFATINRGLASSASTSVAAGSVAGVLPYLLGTILAFASLWFGLRRREPWLSTSQRNLNAFWMGASIYVGTFLLGNNWDYRLAFLLFAVPQLSEWGGDLAGARALLARITMGLLVLSCWYLLYWNWLYSTGTNLAFVVDQVVDWSLFGALAYLLASSLPDSLRSLLINPRGPQRQPPPRATMPREDPV